MNSKTIRFNDLEIRVTETIDNGVFIQVYKCFEDLEVKLLISSQIINNPCEGKRELENNES